MDGNEDPEPPDIESSSQDIFLDTIESSKIEQHKKRKHSDPLGSEPKVKTNMASPPNCAISTVFIHPDADSKKQYSSTDPGPYIVHVSYTSATSYSGATLRPIKFGQFLLQNKIKNISKDGLKKIGRNRISVQFTSSEDANIFLSNPILRSHNYEVVIPTHIVTRMGVIRGVPVDIGMDELVSSLKFDISTEIIKARRLNRKIVKEDRTTEWIPTQTVVLTFSGQISPSHVYCFFTSFPVEKYILPTIQCFNCCRFGHVKSKCRSNPRCYKCGEPHPGDSCVSSVTTCIHCNDKHSAIDKICPEMKRQKQIKIIMSQDNISYIEASSRCRPARQGYSDITASPAESSLQNSKMSYKKTLFKTKEPNSPASSHGYNRDIYHQLTQTPKSSLSNGCALSGKTESSNDNLMELLLNLLINMLSKFDDVSLPSNVSYLINNLSRMTKNNGSKHDSTVELS